MELLQKIKKFTDELWYRGYHAFIWVLIFSFYITTGETKNINHLFVWFTCVLIMLGLLIIMYAKSTLSNRHSFERQTRNTNKGDMVQSFTLIVIIFLLMIIVKQLYILFFGHEEFANDQLIKENIGMLIPFFITSCIVSPIFEEIIFRGYAYMAISGLTSVICNRFKIQHYEKHITLAAFFILPSVIFGVIHKQGNIFSLLTYIFAGVMFSLLFILTKRIWVSIVAHFINNSYAALQMVYIKQIDYGNEWLIIVYLSIIVILGVILYKYYPNIKEVIINYDKKHSETN